MNDDEFSFFDIIEYLQTIWGFIVLFLLGVGLFAAWLGTLAKPPETAVTATLEAEKRLASVEVVQLEPETNVNIDTSAALKSFETAKASRQISKLGDFVQSYPNSKKVEEAKALAEKSLRRQGSEAARRTYIRYFGTLPTDLEQKFSSPKKAPAKELVYNQDTVDLFESTIRMQKEFAKIRAEQTGDIDDEIHSEISYEGPRNFDGEPHGIGKMTFETGIIYEGRFENGKRTIGETRYTNGDVYTGGYEGPYANGQGIIKYADGIVYEGTFKKGNAEGLGTIKNKEGHVIYKGNFKSDEMHGRGVLNMEDGSIYEGFFKAGKFDGRGTLKKTDKTIIYEGSFKSDEMHGHGVLKMDDGTVYEGFFKTGKFDGHGVLRNTDGTIRYKGDFKSDYPHGQGKLNFSEGGFYEGGFFEGDAQGQGIRYFKEGDFYQGECKTNLAHGEGAYDNPEWDDVIVGKFVDGELTDFVCRQRGSEATYQCSDYTAHIPCK